MSSISQNHQQIAAKPKLIPEIRSHILRTVLNQHQSIIELDVSKDMVNPRSRSHPLLQVNQEFRGEAEKVLTKLSFYSNDASKHRYIYLDMETDIVYLRMSKQMSTDKDCDYDPFTAKYLYKSHQVIRILQYFTGAISDEQRKKVKHIAVDIVSTDYYSLHYHAVFSEVISLFPALERFIIVLAKTRFSLTEPFRDRSFVQPTFCLKKAVSRPQSVFFYSFWNQPKVPEVPKLVVACWEGCRRHGEKDCSCKPGPELKIT
jgi:hypothetical protein